MNPLPLALQRMLPALVCACASSVAAQEPPVILITGSLVPRTLGSEMAATSVLGRGDLERAGVRDLVSALDLLGTALVEQQGGPGTVAFVRLRGADSRDTLVLVDGVPLNDVTSGVASLSQIPVALIERVEVVRGNLSALYGANATGGVIQVFTRRGAPGLHASVSAGAGSRGTRAVEASIAGGSEALRARVAAGAERTAGFSAIDPAVEPNANPDADGNRRRHAALALDAAVSPAHAFGLDLRLTRGLADYDSAFGTPADTHGQYLLQRGATLRGRHAPGASWSFAWRLSDSDETRRDTVERGAGPSSTGIRVANRVGAMEASGALGAAWRLHLGAERLSQSTDSADHLVRRRRTDVLRAGLTRDAAWGSVQVAVRRDRTSDFGSASTGLVGATWRFAPRWSAVASVSSSFTPPTFDFLYYDCTSFGFVCSNPALRPERSRNADLALQWQDGTTLLRATLFAARQRDKIANDENFVPQNIARTRNEGVELAARTTLGAWRLAGEATLHDPVDADTGARLLRRASRQWGLRADYDGAAWSAGARVREIGERSDFGGVELPSYAVVDLSGRWNVAPSWSVQVTMDNAFDRRYQPTAGYHGKPRGVFVGLRWQTSP